MKDEVVDPPANMFCSRFREGKAQTTAEPIRTEIKTEDLKFMMIVVQNIIYEIEIKLKKLEEKKAAGEERRTKKRIGQKM